MKRRAAFTTASAVLLIVVITLTLAPSTGAAEYKPLYKLQGWPDGASPRAAVIFDTVGNLYGTTRDGGSYGYGAVFKLVPNPDGSWTESLLYSFKNDRDGRHPNGLVFDTAGNLYGTTGYGYPYWKGTVFKLTPNPDGSWTHSVLHSFTSPGGAYPYAGLIFDAAGNLYGTTGSGGTYDSGTVFKLTPNPDGNWTESVLHNFTGADGAFPYAGLVFDAAGSLYGTTYIGGPYSLGTVFKLTPNPDGSWKRSKVHNFNGADGANPRAELIFDAAGNLYGTTLGGGTHGLGTVFKLAPNPDGSWKRSKLHNFNGTDGARPYAGLIFDAAGNLYGTTAYGGAYVSGTVFKLTRQPDEHWKLSRIHVFKNRHHPWAGLVYDAAGHLYGTTSEGGIKNNGLVFTTTP